MKACKHRVSYILMITSIIFITILFYNLYIYWIEYDKEMKLKWFTYECGNFNTATKVRDCSRIK